MLDFRYLTYIIALRFILFITILASLLVVFMQGCGSSSSPDCPDPRGNPHPGNSLSLVSGNAEFCAAAILDLPGQQFPNPDEWNPESCEFIQSGTGIDLADDGYIFNDICQVDASGVLDCEVIYTWPSYGEECIFKVQA